MTVESSIKLVESFLNQYAVDTHQFKKERTVLLTLDGGINIIVAVEEDFIRLTGIAGEVPKNRALHYDLLTENFKATGHSHYKYAIDPENEELLISLIVQSDDHNVDQFIKLANDFIIKCRYWMNHLYTIGIEGLNEEEALKLSQKQQEEDIKLSAQAIKA